MSSFYDLDSNQKFIWSDGKYIWVSFIKDINTPAVRDNNWKHLDTGIGPGEKFTGLSLFNVKLTGTTLESLATKLSESRLMVNREGFCYFRCGGIVGPSYKEEYFRLNDLFDWKYEYGVDLPSTTQTSWMRCALESGRNLTLLG